MSSLSLRLPDFLHRKIRELAEQDHISINQFIATAVAEKGGGAADCGVSRGAWPPSGSQLVDRLLSPDVPPVHGDELPGAPSQPDKALQPTSRRQRRVKSRRPRAARGCAPGPLALRNLE